MAEWATPVCVCGAYAEFASEPENCLRGVKWSPDGACLLTASEDRHLRLFELPNELLPDEGEMVPSVAPTQTELSAVLKLRAADAHARQLVRGRNTGGQQSRARPAQTRARDAEASFAKPC